MKRLTSLVIVGLFCFGLVGCDGAATENEVITTDSEPVGAVTSEADVSQYEAEMMKAQSGGDQSEGDQ